ncbi:helix-turn-helix domain-containing protein [Amycolatopsis vastitatis]|uniref:DNA-binding protein n=1 Tax=Amycolatopsis vastitatis TaxID=1905142 RepID=A0A229TDW0_9PSEU|nr:helix-turn-helix domain-containing protein [Amycolatopsis vastitatis]OXM69348.1 DNA-binding protein [Amycolatopsis vastitatis]
MYANLGEFDPAKQLYKIPEAMHLLGLGRSVIYEQIRARRLRSVKQGRARLIPVSAIREYVALLEKEAEILHDEAA